MGVLSPLLGVAVGLEGELILAFVLVEPAELGEREDHAGRILGLLGIGKRLASGSDRVGLTSRLAVGRDQVAEHDALPVQVASDAVKRERLFRIFYGGRQVTGEVLRGAERLQHKRLHRLVTIAGQGRRLLQQRTCLHKAAFLVEEIACFLRHHPAGQRDVSSVLRLGGGRVVQLQCFGGGRRVRLAGLCAIGPGEGAPCRAQMLDRGSRMRGGDVAYGDGRLPGLLGGGQFDACESISAGGDRKPQPATTAEVQHAPRCFGGFHREQATLEVKLKQRDRARFLRELNGALFVGGEGHLQRLVQRERSLPHGAGGQAE